MRRLVHLEFVLAAGFAAAVAYGACAAEDWYSDAKLGMFVHWGLYAADGQGEWAMFRNGIAPEDYARHAEAWNPETGCEERWVRMAKDAGVRYMVLTTRHHDGFSLWDTKTDAFNSMNTPAKRDHVRAYVEACRKYGMKVGLYYSLVDWRLRDTDPAKMKANAWAQLEELMTKYGRIDVLWYDGSWHPKDMTTAEFWESERLNAKIREWQPGILINDRSGTKEDFQTIEGRNIPRPPEGAKRWESCLTLQDDDWSFWGYCNHTAFRKTPEQIVCQLIHCLELGGNLLVNVGPDARGEIDPWQCDLFAKVGGWIAAHKDAVYGSRPTEVAAKTPLAKGWSGNSCGFFTEADDRYYLFLHAWPGERTTFPYFTGCVKAVRLDGREISFELDASEHRLTLTGLPKDPPDDVCPVLELFKDAVPAVCPVVAFADRVPREKGEIFRLDSGDLVDVVPERTVNFGMGVYHWERVRRPELLARLDASFGWREAKGNMPGSLDVTWPEGDGQVPALVFLCGDGVAALPDEQVAQAVKRGYAVARLDVAGLPVAAAAKTAIAAYDLLRREARVDCAHIGVYGFGATCGRAAYLAGAHEMRFALAAAVDADVPKELLALQAPHLASVGASGADVVRARREFDAAVAATPAWYDYGLSGLDITIFPGEDDLNYGGTLEYFRRPGCSAPALCDLNRILDFCDWRHWRHAPGTPARVERLPDLLTSPKTGRAVTTKEGWEKELRPEIVEFYTREVYGRRPVERPEALTFTTVGRDTPVCGGKGVRREVKISFRANQVRRDVLQRRRLHPEAGERFGSAGVPLHHLHGRSVQAAQDVQRRDDRDGARPRLCDGRLLGEGLPAGHVARSVRAEGLAGEICLRQLRKARGAHARELGRDQRLGMDGEPRPRLARDGSGDRREARGGGRKLAGREDSALGGRHGHAFRDGVSELLGLPGRSALSYRPGRRRADGAAHAPAGVLVLRQHLEVVGYGPLRVSLRPAPARRLHCAAASRGRHGVGRHRRRSGRRVPDGACRLTGLGALRNEGACVGHRLSGRRFEPDHRGRRIPPPSGRSLSRLRELEAFHGLCRRPRME